MLPGEHLDDLVQLRVRDDEHESDVPHVLGVGVVHGRLHGQCRLRHHHGLGVRGQPRGHDSPVRSHDVRLGDQAAHVPHARLRHRLAVIGDDAYSELEHDQLLLRQGGGDGHTPQ